MEPPTEPEDPAEDDAEDDAPSEDEAYQEYWVITEAIDGQW